MTKQEFKEARLAYIVLAVACTIAMIICNYINPSAVIIFAFFSVFLWGIIAGFIVLTESDLLCFADKQSREAKQE
jgi:hypothetical protein